MLRKFSLLLTVVCMLSTVVVAQVGQGALKGKITNKANGEGVPFANVVLYSGDIQAGATATDIDGNYTIKPISPGTYTLKASYIGFSDITINDVKISGDKTTYYDLSMTEGEEMDVIELVFVSDLVSTADGSSGKSMDAKQFEKLPVRDIGEIQGLTAGVDRNGQIRGTRGNASQIFIDGIKVRGNINLPRQAIGEVNTITGGIPAQYGDLTGGVTSITTKGPSPVSFKNIELVSSGLKINDQDEVWGLDNEAYNLIGLTYGGPLLFKKKEDGTKDKPLVGVLLATEYISRVDPRPSIVQNYQANEDVIESLQNDPLRETGTGSGSVPNSYFLRSDDFKLIDTRRNVGRKDWRVSANLDFNTSNNTTLKFGGSYIRTDEMLEVRNGGTNGQAFSLLNYENNPNTINSTWRAFGRFTQNFNSELDQKEGEEISLIRNAYIQFQVDYTQVNGKTQNANHEDRLFDYGYIGQFIPTRITDEIGNYSFRVDSTADMAPFLGYFYEGPNQTQLDFVPGDKNPVLANYTSDYYSLYRDSLGNLIYPGNYDRIDNISTGGGLLNGATPRNVYNIWSDVGTQYNGYSESRTQQYRITAQGSADIGKHHAVMIGFEYEQRDDRFYSIAPIRLWTVGRQLMNNHLDQLDKSNYTIDNRWGNYPTVTFERLYAPENQSTFDKNVREALGFAPDGLDFIDIDAYDPGEFDVSYFSPDELLNGGNPLISYSGYDHKGERTSGGRPTIDDFFSKKDDDGKFTREIPSFQPIYVAGYIQDRFDFDDLIFRLGLRVDRFDANQSVLKDDYSLFPTIKAGNSITGSHPSNIGDDFVVYVSDEDNPTTDNIVGYRDLNGNNPDIWYDATGREVSNPEDIGIGNSEGTAPWLVDTENNDPSTDLSSASFEDYTPQITVMPRVSFSFPISDVANFYANYDVLTQRPNSNLQMDPIDYLFMGTRNVPINNPNLRPVKQVTYEIGFGQGLTKTTSITYSAFYRESRDDIQVVRKFGAYPVSYRTFENIDFGTVKGLSVEYDMRPIGRNLRMFVNYTLQFAEGTGSSSTSQLNLVTIGQPNLRTIQPLTNDVRHTINLSADYRFGDKENYKGPRWFGSNIFQDAGASVIMQTASGNPYTKSSTITSGGLFSGGQPSRLEGGINGSRYPWNFNMDLRVDKTFRVQLNGDRADRPKYGQLNVYVQVYNLLNSQNVFGAYIGTGSAEDDGYLAEPMSQPNIQNQNDSQSFIDLYNAKLLNDGFYSAQRRIRLGLNLSF